MVNYIVAVLALSLQQDFVEPEQQDFPFAHFFFLPPSAKVTPVINKAAVANKNTFFMIMIFIVINQGKCSVERAKYQFLTVKSYKVAITVTPPCTAWFN